MRGFSTVLQADSIETYGGGLFVCGTYSLRNDEATGRRWREGLIHLVCADDAEERPRQSVACGGVLDLKWRRGGEGLLASVESEAGLGLLKLADGRLEPVLRGRLDRQRRALAAEAPPGLINLSADWSSEGRLAVSHDDGSVSLWEAEGPALRCLHWWQGHDNEAWIVACHREAPHLLWTGGDDTALRGWDLRTGIGSGKHVFEARSGAGVTAAQHCGGPLWAVGGYDEQLQLRDERRPERPLAQLPGLGGGVWRIKRHPAPEQQHLWVLACMRGGFRVVSYEEGVLRSRLHYTAHEAEALAYGVDWLPERGRVACCSFYDARCSLFDWPPPVP